jgi:voltage-gated potassium channel Kch
VGGLPAWGRTLVVLGAVAAIVAAGRFVVRPLLRAVARTRLRELFTAAALLLVIGIALLMEQVGLSPALGTFLAGVVLADSEYRHELESDIEPFKGLLLGLFFIAVGASIDFALVGRQPVAIGGLVLLVLLVKGVVLFGLARAFGLGLDQGLLLALSLPQVGEFAFVLLAFATGLGIVTPQVAGVLVAVVALSMAATPLLLLCYERVLQPRVGTRARPERAADEMHDDANPVLICGFERFGNVVGRFLIANGVGTTVIDNDSDRVDLLRRIGLKVYYGDPTRHDLLAAAGAGRARVIVLALEEPARNLELVHTVRKHFPQLVIMARAFDRPEAYDLLEAGVTHVYRETLETSLRVGEEALRLLGWRAHQAHRRAQAFHRHDEHGLRELALLWRDKGSYWTSVRSRIEAAARLFEMDRAELARERDAGWDPETLRDEVRQGGLRRET